MKIYCLMLDCADHNPKIENFFKERDLHYARQITNSYTIASLSSMFSGLPSNKNNMYSHAFGNTYHTRAQDEKDIVDKQTILNQLPKDWNFHIIEKWRWMKKNLCTVKNNLNEYIYTKYKDEIILLKSMQDLPSGVNDNHFILFLYEELHEAILHDDDGEYEKAIDQFIDILSSINFNEKDSLFWIFADHGDYRKADKCMMPPSAWLTWASVTDNITNRKTTKKLVHMQDFYNTVYNRAYNTTLDNLNYDVLDETPDDKIYICDDGRAFIDKNKHTTLSAIKYLSNNNYLQVMYHSPEKLYKYILFNSDTNEIQNTTIDGDHKSDIEIMLNHMHTEYGVYFDD